MQYPDSQDFETTLAELCAQSVQQFPDRVLLKWQQESWSNSDVVLRAYQLAEALQSLGVGPREPVGVMLDNHPDHITMILALGLMNVIWVPLDRRFKPANVQNVLNLLNLKVIVTERHYQQIISQTDFQGDLLFAREAVHTEVDQFHCDDPAQPDDIRALMFTSGTTGAAKAVQVTERMYIGAALFCGYASDANESANYYLWEPLNHIGGAQIIPMAMMSGSRISMTKQFSASRFWKEVIESSANRLHYLGGILDMLLAQPLSDMDRQHDVSIGFGAAASAETSRAFRSRFGVTLREVYGMTEAASFTTINLDGPPGSIGKPMDYFSVSLHDEEGAVVGVDQVGEIALKSMTVPLLTPGYYRNPEATAKAFRSDKFFTGDLARQDEQGYLYFYGRVKDRIRCKGEMISATDIESVFNDHPGVVESAVVGVNSEFGEQELVVFVQCVVDKDNTDHRYSVDEIVAWSDKQLATFQQPRYVMTVEQFPRTPSLRIAKHRLLNDGKIPTVEWDRDSQPD